MFQIRPNHNSEYKWYIWYTKPRAEKKVRDRLIAKGVNILLPLQNELRQWSDRKKWVETPLFSGYIFTYISQREWDTVTFTEGLLTYVRSEGKPAVICQNQIDQIKCVLDNSEACIIAEEAGVQPGDMIEVLIGPFTGMHGEMINYKGSYKLVVRIEHLEKVMLVNLPVSYIKSLKEA